MLVVASGCANGADVLIIVADAGDAGVGPTEDGGGAAPDGSHPVDDAATGDASPGACADWAGPTVVAKCNDSCTKHTCGPNGCYGNWWCQISARTCAKAPPAGCN